nr:hypothetical protein [Tanacetum cinerariifolium]
TTVPRGERTGGPTSRGGRRTGEPTGRVGGRTSNQGGQGGDRGNHTSNIQGDVRSVNVGNDQNGCLYKEFMVCNPKDYDGKGGAIVYTRWIEKMESVRDMSGFGANQKRAMLKGGMLTDEAIRNGSLRKNADKRGNGRELSRNGNVRDDNKRSRTGRAFSIVTNPVRKEYTGHFARDCRAGPRMVTPVNARTDNCSRVTWRSIHDRSIESSPGPEHYDGYVHSKQPLRYNTIRFRVDYSFVSTSFIPLLDIDPSNLGFSYEIETAHRQLVEINKVTRDCKLEIEGHTFDIDLIPFRYESFDVIVRMDWLSRDKAKIVCHEKVVRIPLPHDEILRVLGVKSEEKVRYLMSSKTEEQKLRDIVVVRNFPEIFLDDLSRLPPS